MFPNPQDALPLPRLPSLEQYRKLAKELVKAWRSDSPDAVAEWADQWMDALARASGWDTFPNPARRKARAAAEVDDYASQLKKERSDLTLADAQFAIARSHGFVSWPEFCAHLDALAHTNSETAAFEAAADAIVGGDEARLARLLAENPDLVKAHSSREHRATLLIYVAANGVEGYRQRTPKNIVRITEMLLDAGADIEGTADVYGGHCSTLGLAATSAHPRIAKLQIPLLELLLSRGAGMDDGAGGHRRGVVFACIANGCPEAADFLASRGARIGLTTAAALGKLDAVRTTLEGGTAGQDEINEAFRYACAYGRTETAEYLVNHGSDFTDGPGDGQTGTHYTVITGRLETLQMLLKYNPPLELENTFGGTVLGQAMWSAAHGGDPDTYIAIIQALLDAGAKLDEKHVPVNEKVDAFLATKGSLPETKWYWYGEHPRKTKG
ncbi:MAG TPA: ankyrin repeat domain-containing protein [Gemmatimonadales bacterium]